MLWRKRSFAGVEIAVICPIAIFSLMKRTPVLFSYWLTPSFMGSRLGGVIPPPQPVNPDSPNSTMIILLPLTASGLGLTM